MRKGGWLALVGWLAFGGFAPGQGDSRVVVPDLGGIADGKSWALVNARARSSEEGGRQVARLEPRESDPDRPSQVGIAYLEGLDFGDGTIEVDLKGRDAFQRSFLGVAFHGVDGKTFEAVYFRPFNFRAPGERRGRAVQYISWPEHTWEKLRKERPGVYEHPVEPVPDPDGWFHARIEVRGTTVKVFVDDAKEPSLIVERLSDRPKGRVGLWADLFDATFANLKITQDR